MYFSEDVLLKFRADCESIYERKTKLTEAYLTYHYTNEKAREHAQHGFSRRLEVLVRCIYNTFTILPPEMDSLPDKEMLLDATFNRLSSMRLAALTTLRGFG